MTIINCELDIRNKRCSECMRPLCQRRFINNNKWEDINIPEIYNTITEYEMHGLYLG